MYAQDQSSQSTGQSSAGASLPAAPLPGVPKRAFKPIAASTALDLARTAETSPLQTAITAPTATLKPKPKARPTSFPGGGTDGTDEELNALLTSLQDEPTQTLQPVSVAQPHTALLPAPTQPLPVIIDPELAALMAATGYQ